VRAGHGGLAAGRSGGSRHGVQVVGGGIALRCWSPGAQPVRIAASCLPQAACPPICLPACLASPQQQHDGGGEGGIP
jgi:hypothetical protein